MTETKDMDWNTLAIVGIIGGLICIYAAVLLNAAIPDYPIFQFVAAGGAILATVWGADAVRKICKYGIGTGVPSIGMLAFGMGLVSTLLGLKIGDYLAASSPGLGLNTNIAGVPLGILIGPIAAVILSLVQGAVVGFLAQNVLKMKIPTMQVGMTYIAGAASVILISYFTLITGTFAFGTVVDKVIATGFIAPVFMIGALPMLHPFNACLGPDETQKRTLTLAVEATLMTVIVFGILSFATPVTISVNSLGHIIADASAVTNNSLIASGLIVVLGLIAWIIAYWMYWKAVKASGVIVLETGVLPKKEA